MNLNSLISPRGRRLVTVILSWWMLPGPGWGEEQGNWKLQEIAGVETISVDQIQTFYRFDKSTRDGAAVTLENQRVALKLEAGSPEGVINGIKIIFSKPVVESEGKLHLSRADLTGLLDPMLRPDFIRRAGKFNAVILDPAHGGKDPGIANEFGTEAGFTLKIAELTRRLLGGKGYQVILTRDEDADVSPEERLNLANAVAGNAIFIGISFASGPESMQGIQTSPLARGAEAIASDPFGQASVALAASVHGSLVRRLGKNTVDAGIKRGGPEAFSKLAHPAIFIEAGYMTHPMDARLIRNEAYQSAIAAGIVDGIGKFSVAVGSKPVEIAEPAAE